VRWQANRHVWFQAGYGIFYAGKFVKESQPGRKLNYWALWASFNESGHWPGGRRQFLSLDLHPSTCKLQVS
jgi:hypothetical protein